MPLAFIGVPAWLRSLSLCQGDIFTFKYRVVSPVPSQGLSRLFPFHPPQALMTSAPNRGRKDRDAEWWQMERGVGVRGQREGKEVGGLDSQGDDEGKCVWFGKWVAGICVSLGTTIFFFVRT